MSAYQVGVLIGSIGVGCIMGAIPAICGAVKGKIRLAVIGFFACVISVSCWDCCYLFLCAQYSCF